MGYAYALAGRVPDGLALLKPAVEHLEQRGYLHRHSRRVGFLGEAFLLWNRLSESRKEGRRALDLARAHGERGNEAYALRLLGEIARQGDSRHVAEAEGYFRRALALADELGMRPLVAHCRLGLGKLLQRMDRASAARAELATAIEMLRAMDMTFWLPEAEAELAALE